LDLVRFDIKILHSFKKINRFGLTKIQIRERKTKLRKKHARLPKEPSKL